MQSITDVAEGCVIFSLFIAQADNGGAAWLRWDGRRAMAWGWRARGDYLIGFSY